MTGKKATNAQTNDLRMTRLMFVDFISGYCTFFHPYLCMMPKNSEKSRSTRNSNRKKNIQNCMKCSSRLDASSKIIVPKAKYLRKKNQEGGE